MDAKIEADRVAHEAWRARLAADAPLPKVRIATNDGRRVEAIVRLDGDRLYTRLPGNRSEASWALDGDVWRCERFNGLTLKRQEVERNTTGARVQGRAVGCADDDPGPASSLALD